MLLIGSRAMPRHLLDREPLDWDFICTWEEFEAVGKDGATECYPTNGGNTMVLKWGPQIREYEIAWPGSSASILLDHWTDRNEGWIAFADIDLLFTLKATHRFRKDSPHFEKTRRDYLALEAAGAVLCGREGQYREFYDARCAEYKHAHPKLNVKKSEFFVPGGDLQYVYDHDSIHVSVALGPDSRPAYTYFKRPGSEVMCDRQLFEASPPETQLNSVIEEACVLALERSQIPFPGRWSPARSYRVALQKVASSISSGWWREFSWLHYDEALAGMPDYVGMFRSGIENGTVKLAAH